MAVATRSNAPTRLGYRPALDGLRAVAVMAVILYHADISWIPGGFLGVEVFFVVSGFLITSLLLEERAHSGAIDLRHFWVRRGRRLLPALYLLLVVTSVATLLVYHDAAGRMGGDVIAAIAYVYNWWQIFLDQSYFAQAGRPPLLQHLWSLAVEEQFYLVFPPIFALCLARFRHLRVRWVVMGVGLASAVLMAVLYRSGEDTSFIYYATFTRLSGLLLGSFLAMVWTPWRSRAAAAPTAGPVLDGVGTAGLLIIAWFFLRVNAFDPFVYRGGFLLLDVTCIVVIAVLVHPAARLSAVLSWAPLVWIGLRSYSLYLWHWPIFMVTRPGIDVSLTGLPLFVLRIGLTFGAAELSFRLIETPMRRGALGRWYNDLRASDGVRRQALRRRGVVLAGAVSVLVLVISAGLYRSATSPDRERIELAAMGDATAQLSGVPTAAQGDDPSAPVTTGAVTSTTTTTSVSTTTVAGAASTTVAAPTPTAPPSPMTQTNALAVGDSVMLGAQSALYAAMPGLRVDAKVGRQFTSISDVVGWYASEGLIAGPLIVHAGTNGTFTDGDIDKLLDNAAGRKILLVNAKVARPWQDLVNQRMAAAAQRHPDAVLVDWYGLSSGHPEWFAPDGAHLRPDGARAFAELIRSNL